MSERKEWLEQRMEGIGGSDISAVLGVNPWRTPLDVWLEKTGRGETWATEPERVKWGKLLEPAIARGYAEDCGLAAGELFEPGLLRHRKCAPILGTPDRMYSSRPRGLEIKAVNQFAISEYGEEGTDAVPDHYHLQADHYLFLTDFKEWDLAVLFGGQHLGVFTVRRNLILDGIIAEASVFGATTLSQSKRPRSIRASDTGNSSRGFCRTRRRKTSSRRPKSFWNGPRNSAKSSGPSMRSQMTINSAGTKSRR
jgi:putative phage-type endonuclease